MSPTKYGWVFAMALSGCSTVVKAPIEVIEIPTQNKEIKIVKSKPLTAVSAVGTSGFDCSEQKYIIRWCYTQYELNNPSSLKSKYTFQKFLGSTLAANQKLIKADVLITWPLECVNLRELIGDYKTCRDTTHFLLPLNPFNFLEKVYSYELYE